MVCFEMVLHNATGAAAIATSPLPSGRASQRSPSPPQGPVKAGSTDEDEASMLELPESRQRLLGTEWYVFSPRIEGRGGRTTAEALLTTGTTGAARSSHGFENRSGQNHCRSYPAHANSILYPQYLGFRPWRSSTATKGFERIDLSECDPARITSSAWGASREEGIARPSARLGFPCANRSSPSASNALAHWLSVACPRTLAGSI